ncbi:MAG: geranylgeranyl reductase family protein [Bacteroidales bacterium]|nr:geranylgeranyl reductase family protein [Bacteroidales bacterium]
MSIRDFDLVIAGAGPAGCTLALKLAHLGLHIAVIDKDVFPRHKICGDALSGQAINVLKRLPDGVFNDFIHQVEKVPSHGIRFVAPNFQFIDIPFFLNQRTDLEAPGFICKRTEFDTFLFNRLKGYNNISLFEGERIIEVDNSIDFVSVKTSKNIFHAPIVAGADGVHSIIRESIHPEKVSKKHFCVGIRAYFENVADLHPGNFIELIFLKELLPAYFWIFPSSKGQANVGFGMMQNRIIDQKENLSLLFSSFINSHPLLSPRFKNAIQVSKAQAHSLPLGTYHLPLTTDRLILMGDAAFLVDPFSGEGIGNAMASGEIAASVLTGCFQNHDFSLGSLKEYDYRIAKRFGSPFRTTTILQQLAKSAWLFNLVINKAHKNKSIQNLLTTMYTQEEVKKQLTRPGFYLKLLFK